MPLTGSDGRTHLVYELWITNASGADAVLEKLEVLDGERVLLTLEGPALAARLRPGANGEPTAHAGPLRAELCRAAP